MREFILKRGVALWFLGLAVVFCCFYVTTHRINLREHWHLPGGDPDYWMSQDATLDIYLPWEDTMAVSFEIQSYQRPRTLQLLVNGIEHSQYEISPLQKSSVVILTPLAQGVNTLTFHAEPECALSWQGGDLRCLSFELSGFQVSFPDTVVEVAEDVLPPLAHTTDVIRYEGDWFDQERSGEKTWRWMTDRATLQVFGNRAQQSQNRIMKVQVSSFHNDRTLQVYAGNEVVFEGDIPTSSTKVQFTLPAWVLDNLLTFVSKNGCERPRDVEEGSRDMRCLSFSVERIMIERNTL